MKSASNASLTRFRTYPQGNPDAYAARNFKNVTYTHDPRLAVTVSDGFVNRNINEDAPYFAGQFSLSWEKSNSSLDLAREFFGKFPGATAMAFSYGRFNVIFEGAVLYEMLNIEGLFRNWIEIAWLYYVERLDGNHSAQSGPSLLSADLRSAQFRCIVSPTSTNTPEDLLSAMQIYGYVLAYEAIGVVDPDDPETIHLYTGGKDPVDTQFGSQFSNLDYFDLRDWDGEAQQHPLTLKTFE